MQGGRVALTVQRIAQAVCPAGKSQALIWDAQQPGLALHVYPSGRKVFLTFYRVGGGRKGGSAGKRSATRRRSLSRPRETPPRRH